jgi:hypothetical protein
MTVDFNVVAPAATIASVQLTQRGSDSRWRSRTLENSSAWAGPL